jgi:subtilisin-like proprotein convertase family protein
MTKPKFLILAFLALALSANSVLAQLPTGVDPGPSAGDRPTYTSKEEASVKERLQGQQSNTVQNPPVQTDEYGFFNFNAYLSGLGATGGYVAIPGAFNENVDGSVEAWVFPTATTSSAPCIVGKGDATNVGFLFGWVASSSFLYMRFGNNPTTNTGGTTVPLNTWTHVACTWSGGAGNYTITFYVNGAISGASVNNTGTWNVTSDSMTIGSIKAPFGGKNFFGFIDEVRYWSDVRTATEIRDNRFVGIGDGANANSGNAITSSSHYAGVNSMYNFNVGGSAPDYIGGTNGFFRNSAGTVYSSFAPTPMAYNYAVLCPFAATSYVTVPDNTVFNQNTDGTAEAWVYPTGQTTTHMLISRGTTGFQFFWGIRASISNRQAVNIGSGSQFQNTDGVVIPLNRWTHVAVKWTSSGGNFTCTFYVNGKQSGSPVTNATTWNSLSGTMRIGGWHGGTANNFNGYLDEVRWWAPALSEDQIRQNMFTSGRALLPNANLLGIWNFDGNLNNFSATTGINGSFSTGGTNNCRFSSYLNENTAGALSNAFIAHPTVINRFTSPNPFPAGYIVKPVGKPIPDNQTTRDTITVPGSATLTSIEVLLSIQHTFCADLDITLRAPNGQTRDLTSDNGGTGENILTIFVDGQTNVTNAAFFPPWTHIAGPEVAMGSFGSTNIQGNWILEVTDDASPDPGTLVGWGLRFNGAVTNIDPLSGNIPGRFRLYQNYPNPFNPATTIKFDIAKNSEVKIRIYDILGREVNTLVNEFKNAGAYEVKFDASNMASGTYFYKIEASDFVDIKKMVLIK